MAGKIAHDSVRAALRARYASAKKALTEEDLAAADRTLSSILAEHPGHLRSILLIARLRFKLRDWLAAQSFVRLALAQRPEHIRTLVLASRIAEKRGDIPLALEYRRRAEQLQAPGVLALVAHARLLALAGRIDDARVRLLAAIKLDPDFRGAREALERLNIPQGEFEFIAQPSRQAARLMATARLLQADGNTAAAASAWEEAASSLGVGKSVPVALFPVKKERKARIPKRRVNIPDDFAHFIIAADSEDVIRVADDLTRIGDGANLFRLSGALGAHPDTTRGSVLRTYVEAKHLFINQCFDPCLTLADGLLDDAAAHQAFGSLAEHCRSEISRIFSRSLIALGRARGEHHGGLTPTVETVSADGDQINLENYWVSDPARVMGLASKLAYSIRPRPQAAILSCYLPLSLGDPATAERNFDAQIALHIGLERQLPAELVLCGFLIKLERIDFPAAAAYARCYFRQFDLEYPVSMQGEHLRFETMDLKLGETKRSGPLVTVIMTAYNAQGTVDCAIRSILSQTHRNLELIIVDDASTDGTWDRIQSAALGDSRVVPLRNHRNVGTYVSKNTALLRAQGVYYTCHDADDWAHPRRIERHVTYMSRHPRLVATTSNWIRMDERGRPVIRRSLAAFTHKNPASPFIRMDVARETVGFYDSVRIDADLEHWRRLTLACGIERTARLRAPLTIGRHHSTSLTRAGVGAQDDENYSPVRSAYRHRAFEWRRSQLIDGSLRIENDLSRRPFSAPEEIVVGAQLEPCSARLDNR